MPDTDRLSDIKAHWLMDGRPNIADATWLIEEISRLEAQLAIAMTLKKSSFTLRDYLIEIGVKPEGQNMVLALIEEHRKVAAAIRAMGGEP